MIFKLAIAFALGTVAGAATINKIKAYLKAGAIKVLDFIEKLVSKLK